MTFVEHSYGRDFETDIEAIITSGAYRYFMGRAEEPDYSLIKDTVLDFFDDHLTEHYGDKTSKRNRKKYARLEEAHIELDKLLDKHFNNVQPGTNFGPYSHATLSEQGDLVLFFYE